MKHSLPPDNSSKPSSNGPPSPPLGAPEPKTGDTAHEPPAPNEPQGKALSAGLIIGLLALSALAVGGIFVWLGVRNLTSVEEHGQAAAPLSASTRQRFAENPAPGASRIQAAPVQLLKPEEVLSEAEAMRGPLFGKGYVQSGSDSVSVLDAVAILRRGRTEVELAFFGAELSEEQRTSLQNAETFAQTLTPTPLLRVKIALSPFGSDCTLVGVKNYELVSGSRSLSRVATDSGATELKKISCQRKKGELVELQAEGAFPAEGVKGKPAGSESKWAIEARVPLN